MKFETENASYNLHPANHFITTKVETPEDYDAFIIESGREKYENLNLNDLNESTQYKKIGKNASKLGKSGSVETL